MYFRQTSQIEYAAKDFLAFLSEVGYASTLGDQLCRPHKHEPGCNLRDACDGSQATSLVGLSLKLTASI